jgi:2-methylcitrate dehydratase PrpD
MLEAEMTVGSEGGADPDVRALAAFAAEITAAELPGAVVDRITDIVLDTAGTAILGSRDGFLTALRGSMLGRGSGGASVLGTEVKADAGWAAFCNAAACTTVQLDEGHRQAIGHPAIHVALPAYAVAEQEGASGEELIAAVAAAYEVAVRIGLALGRLRPGLHAHGHWPVIGGAVAVAKLLGAGEAGLVAAIEGAATLVLYPTTRTTTDGVDVHHYYAGLGALIAVAAGYGAAAGMTASDRTVAEHLAPFSGSPGLDRAALATNGHSADGFHVLGNYFKVEPVCAHAIPALEAVRSLLPEIGPDATLSGARVRTYGYAAELDGREPASSLAAKFSIPYVVAGVLEAGVAGLALHDLDPTDPGLREMMARVEVITDPELDRRYPYRRPAHVELELEDGRVLTATCDMPLGDSANPVPRERLERKFREMTAPVLGADRSSALLARMLGLAEAPTVSEISELARPARDDAQEVTDE